MQNLSSGVQFEHHRKKDNATSSHTDGVAIALPFGPAGANRARIPSLKAAARTLQTE